MKLLIITQKVDQNDPILGFFHRWLIEFSKVYSKVTVLCLEQGQHSLPSNVSVYSLGKERGVGRVTYLKNFYRFIWKHRDEYDKVLVHMNPIYVILGGIFWKITGKRIALWYTHKLVDLKLRTAVLLADVVFTASAESFRLRSNKVHVMGHGIDAALFSPTSTTLSDNSNSQSPFRIISVGRISLAKNQKLLVDIARLLVPEIKHFMIEVVGGPITDRDRQYDEEFQAAIAASNLEKYIHRLGPKSQQELIPLLRNADVLVNLSDTGSLDKVVLEAMAMAKIPLTCNEAFKDILNPFGLYAEKKDLHVLLSRLVSLGQQTAEARLSTGTELRGYIMKHHDLGRLIRRVADIL